VSQGSVDEGDAALTATGAATEAARDALSRARAQRDELLVLASHDIRNAVGIVDSALSMLEDGPELAPSMHGMMRRATHRLHVLVHALVDTDMLERGIMPVAVTPSRWASLVTPVVETVLPVAATKEIAVVPSGDFEATLDCDPTLVGRLVTALVEHAVAGAPTKTCVDVEGTRVGDDRFRIRVTNGARGLAADTVARYCATLSLRYARLAAARHGGALRVVSPIADGFGIALEAELAA
jgi:signal transduction histidine kinase